MEGNIKRAHNKLAIKQYRWFQEETNIFNRWNLLPNYKHCALQNSIQTIQISTIL